MLDANKLRGEIVRNGYTQAQVAQKIGMSEVTFSRKLKSGKFGVEEASKMIAVLNIQNPEEIFFAKV